MIRSRNEVLSSLLVISAVIYSPGVHAKNVADDKLPKKPQAGKEVVGPTCQSNDSDHLCLALKYVVYQSPTEGPLMAKSEVARNVSGVNEVWKQCNIGFQIEDFRVVSPEEHGLSFNPANESELTTIRSSFEESQTLLVVTTGSWNRSGSLGNSGANAWTSMPGDSPLGAVLESTVQTFPNIIAHELGHYLGLAHFSDASDLMNPIIYDNSTYLSEDQCAGARSTIVSYWEKMVR